MPWSLSVPILLLQETFKFLIFFLSLLPWYPRLHQIEKTSECAMWRFSQATIKHERNQTKSKLNRGKITHFGSIFHRRLTMVVSHAFSSQLSEICRRVGFVLNFCQNREELIKYLTSFASKGDPTWISLITS